MKRRPRVTYNPREFYKKGYTRTRNASPVRSLERIIDAGILRGGGGEALCVCVGSAFPGGDEDSSPGPSRCPQESAHRR